MTFPEKSSHFTSWIFRETKELDNRRTEANSRAASHLKQILVTEEPIAVDAEKELVFYFAGQLIHVCTEKELDYRVTSTAATFFRRFFIKKSIMEYDPRKILMTCIILAVKVEEQGNITPLKHITEGIEGQFDLREMYASELVVLDALAFHLLILHVRSPLHYITTEYFQSRKSGRGPCDLQALERAVTEINAAAEKLSLELFATDIPFFYSPAQLALTCFRYCAEGKLSDVNRFIDSLFRKESKFLALSDKVREKVKAIMRDIVLFEDAKKMITEEKRKSLVLKTLKRMDRIQRKKAKIVSVSSEKSINGSPKTGGSKGRKRREKSTATVAPTAGEAEGGEVNDSTATEAITKSVKRSKTSDNVPKQLEDETSDNVPKQLEDETSDNVPKQLEDERGNVPTTQTEQIDDSSISQSYSGAASVQLNEDSSVTNESPPDDTRI